MWVFRNVLRKEIVLGGTQNPDMKGVRGRRERRRGEIGERAPVGQGERGEERGGEVEREEGRRREREREGPHSPLHNMCYYQTIYTITQRITKHTHSCMVLYDTWY